MKPESSSLSLRSKLQGSAKGFAGNTPPHLQKGAKYIIHGQFKFGVFKKPPPVEGMDNHHSPTNPDNYVKWRLVPARDFYQGKIPRYARHRSIFQGILLTASILSAVISVVAEPTWIAIIASIAGLISAWQEFTGVEKKLDRYSTVANALENVLLEWQSLPETEQASTRNISRLVTMTEGLVMGEQAAWMSDTQQAVRNMQSRKESGDAANAQKRQ